MFPGDYFVATSDPDDVRQRYRTPLPQAVVFMQGFPTFGDDTGRVILARKDNLLEIDRVCYDGGMHYPLLSSSEGVSLERTSPDMPSERRDNWHSAAETSGFATPTYVNSHVITQDDTGGEVVIKPAVFSPDNDGKDDLLTILIRESGPDNAVNIEIYDAQGRKVSQLANNVLLGSEGVFVWDGMTDEKRRAPVGFYIFLVEITRPDGSVRRVKKTAVLGGRL